MHTSIPEGSRVEKRYILILSFTGVICDKATQHNPSLRGSAAVRSSWLKFAFFPSVLSRILNPRVATRAEVQLDVEQSVGARNLVMFIMCGCVVLRVRAFTCRCGER